MKNLVLKCKKSLKNLSLSNDIHYIDLFDIPITLGKTDVIPPRQRSRLRPFFVALFSEYVRYLLVYEIPRERLANTFPLPPPLYASSEMRESLLCTFFFSFIFLNHFICLSFCFNHLSFVFSYFLFQ